MSMFTMQIIPRVHFEDSSLHNYHKLNVKSGDRMSPDFASWGINHFQWLQLKSDALTFDIKK